MTGSGERAERHWKRKRDPRWEKQLFGGRVCFNARLSCTVVLFIAAGSADHLSVALLFPILPFSSPVLPPVTAERTACCAPGSPFSIGEQQPGSGAACPPPWDPLQPCLGPLLSLSSRMHPPPISSNCPATSICIALYAAGFYGGGSVFALRECF